MSERFELNEETRQKMQGLFPINNDWTCEFTPDEYQDLPEEIKPIFIISSLSAKEADQMNKDQISSKMNDSAKYDASMQSIRKHIVDIKNLINLSDNSIVEFTPDPNGGGCSIELFTKLPTIIKASILSKLLKISGLTR